MHVFLFFFLLINVSAFSAAEQVDTLTISLQEAEEMFLQRNFLLLPANYNVEASRAAVVQAGLWENPNITIEQDMYNQYTGRYFDVTSSGNTEIQVEQLFLLAGKRAKRIRLAETQSEMALYAFKDMLRMLRLELRTSFVDLYFLQRSLSFYDKSIPSLMQTVEATEMLFERRSVLLSEVLRLKSLLLSLETERLDIVNRIATKQSVLRILLGDTTNVQLVPVADGLPLDVSAVIGITLETALATALERPDLQSAEAQISHEETNVALQKALAIPDITLGAHWSRAGGYVPNYYGVSISVDLPLFNRNQGNIAFSERLADAARSVRENLRNSVRQQVVEAYRKATAADKLYRAIDRNFANEYNTLVESITTSYRQGHISIVEFADFFQSYRSSMVQLHELLNNRLRAFEELTHAVGRDLLSW